MKALAPALANARRELAANPRLRYGVLAIAAILVLYLFLVLQDWQSGLAERHASRSGYLAKMQALAGQEVWIQRAAAVARTRAALEAEIPEMATLGLAQASAQGWLRDAVVAFGQDVQVQAQTPAQTSQGSIWRVPVVISGRLDPARYIQLLRQIESRPTLAVIEQATVVNRQNRTFSLTVVSYYRIKEAPADAAE
ncbi:hypothetical protein QAA18_08930 [Luteimonas sp. 8-5]|uniref:hypothetical protein n=1 Tax=Luteimonas sp. 8-5 TaxID=3039387 RepID=UPI002436D152|nr:hypothetical protein [Luteimonas sp. 8-5]MDG6348856.1 hypothetical protein [Luteimonas sp. 8-5]